MLTKVVRGLGWTLIGVGVLVLLYVVYLLFYTNLSANEAQNDLGGQWRVNYGTAPEEIPLDPPSDAASADTDEVAPGSAYAAMWFERPGQEKRPVHKETLYVLEGTSLDILKQGPGHYPSSEPPGEGNFAVSGHRTTYGAPFYHLEELRPGDRVHVVDRQQRHFVYTVRKQQVVAPTDVWVLEDDAITAEEPIMTLTTCNPRFSAAQRLIVWAELSSSPARA